MASADGRLWAGGLERTLVVEAGSALSVRVPDLRLDNHWIAV